ncbi:MAG TPA: GtrA family protein [Ktedonobacteraceae bacterium]|nr:GtrA family protein [Ktedonobacteraceae bacterium]
MNIIFTTMQNTLQKLWRKHIVRYAIVGGLGIPINDLALALFLFLFHNNDNLYYLAVVCSFEVSTTINFVLNQLFTYREQSQHIHGWDWVKRALKAQSTSISAQILTILIAIVLKKWLGINEYVASPIGIIAVFLYNFAISKRFVFRPIEKPLLSSELPSAVQTSEEIKV